MGQVDYNDGTEVNDSEVDDQESSPDSYEVITYPADFTLEGLVSKYKKGSLIIPGFQRNYVWNIKQASKLVESFLLGLPVPSIFLFTDEKNNDQLVIDGQQRLKTLVYFFDGYFGDEEQGARRVFRLTGLKSTSPYAEKTYKDLEQSDPAAFNKLNDSVLRAFIVKQITPTDNTSIYHIFERLNTGGTQLVGQEIRNCVYHGSFNDLLCELNRLPSWRKIFGSDLAHRRQKDVELILRFFAFYYDGDDYSRPLKDFMSTFMNKFKRADDEKLSEFRRIFSKTCDVVLSHLGERPFHIWSGLNVAVFDSTFVTIAKMGDAPPADLQERFMSLVSNRDFVAGVRGATADETIVAMRMSLAELILLGG